MRKSVLLLVRSGRHSGEMADACDIAHRELETSDEALLLLGSQTHRPLRNSYGKLYFDVLNNIAGDCGL